MNLYGFAGGDPVNFSDPFGLCPWCLGAVGGVVTGYALAAVTGADYDWKDAAVDAALGAAGVGIVSKLDKLNDLRRASSALNAGGRAMSYSRSQLQHGFKHAKDFGVTGNASNRTLAEFSSAVQRHVEAAGTRAIQGTYRGQAVTHHVDPTTGLNVIQKANGEFLSGWRLSGEQLKHVLSNGKLGGGS